MPDVALDAGRDVPAFDVDWPAVSGAAEAAQNIIEALHDPIGSLPWDRDAGSSLPTWLNSLNPVDRITGELRRVALTIPGVLPQSIVATYDAQTMEYRLAFAHADGTQAAVSGSM